MKNKDQPDGSAHIRILDRLETVLQEESHALSSSAPLEMGSFIARKTQLLLELSSMRRGPGATRTDSLLAGRLERLKSQLALNQRALSCHLDAARQISTIILDNIRAADSDGTYSLRSVRGARP